MKTKVKLILVVAVVTIVSFACRKNPSEGQTNQKYSRMYEKEKVYAKAKTYDLSSEQTYDIIKRFKTRSNNQIRTSNLIAADSVMIDSSIFVIEAALNFDFDDQVDTTNVPTITEVSTYQIAYNTGTSKIKSSELQDTYDDIKTQINASTNSSYKILLVDIDGILDVSMGTITYEAKVERVLPASYAFGCGSSVTNNGSPDLALFNSFGCSGNPPYEGSLLVTSHLPCTFIDQTACDDYYPSYYTNIYNPNQQPYYSSFLDIPNWCPGPASNPASLPSVSYLFCSGPGILPNQHCAAAWKSLSTTQLNGYVSNIPTQFALYVPSTPANMMFIKGWVQKDKDYIQIGATYYWSIWWNLRAYYGVKKCRTTPRD